MAMGFRESSMWLRPHAGPLAREALSAIGQPSAVEGITIELYAGAYTLNGAAVSEADASLVYNASRCDPHRFGPEPAT
ncbi:hypothetical protein ACQKJ1_01470 [Methylorubrum rhodesianum]|uniref:hypothetical protein n=1 Tax=Methylorubrum rhodesianum TaxID=29427 RepID=UPI003D0428BA